MANDTQRQKQRYLDRMRRILKASSLGSAIGILGAVTVNSQVWMMIFSAAMPLSIFAEIFLLGKQGARS